MSKVHNLGPDASSQWGQVVGTGLSGLLNNLAQHKTQQLQQRQLGRTLEQIGVNPIASQLPAELQQIYLKQAMQAPQNAAYAQALQQLTGSGQSVPGQEGQFPSPSGLSERQATELAKLHFQKQQTETAQAQKKQAAIQKHNAPYVQKLQEGRAFAEEIDSISSQMESLLDTGKVASGIKGRLPTELQNKETQEFDALANELALLLASKSGTASVFKIKLTQGMKPNLLQKTEAQRAGIQRLKDKAKSLRSYSDAADKLILDNNGDMPTNLESAVHSYLQGGKKKSFDPEHPVEDLEKLYIQGEPDQRTFSPENQQKLQQQAIQQPGYLEQNKEESRLAKLGRGAVRTGARAGESIVGLPGDILAGIAGLGKAATGIDFKNPLEGITSENIKKVHEQYTGEYLKPQGKVEEFVDEIVKDLSTMVVPLNSKVPFTNALAKSFVRAGLGNAASWATKEVGGGAGSQAVAKIGTMMLAGTIGGKKALVEIEKQGYKAAEELAKGSRHNASSLKNNVLKIANDVAKRDMPGKDIIKGRIKAINNAISRKKIDINNAKNLKVDVNSYIKAKDTPKEVIPTLKRLNGQLSEVIQDYGKKNPEFARVYNNSEEIHKALNATTAAQNFFKKVQNDIPGTVLKGLAGLGIGRFLGIPKAVGGVLALSSAHYGERAIKMFKSPSVRKYYLEAMDAVLREDKSAYARSLEKLSKVSNDTEE